MLLLLLTCILIFPAQASAASVRLSKTSLTLYAGKKATLKLKGSKKKTTWSSSKSSVAAVSAKGVVTAKKKGSAVISARSNGKTYRCRVTVRQPVTSVKLNRQTFHTAVGVRSVLSATVKPDGAYKKTVRWSSSNPAVLKVNSRGEARAVSEGTAVITAMAVDGSGKYGSCTVTVGPAMMMSQSSLQLEVGSSGALSVLNNEGKAVYWGTSDPAVAVVSKGTVIGVGAGEALITAMTSDGSQKVSCTVTVEATAVSLTSPTLKAQQFLAILKRYSDRVVQDKAAGKLWGYSNSSALNPKTWPAAEAALNEKGVTYNNCALLVRIAMREMGILREGQNFWGLPGGGIHFNSGVSATVREHCAIISVYDTAENLIREGKLLPGDICTWAFNYNHTNVYAGNGLFYEAGRGGDGSYVPISELVKQYGLEKKNLKSDNGSSSMYIFNSFGPCASINLASSTVGQIIRIVR